MPLSMLQARWWQLENVDWIMIGFTSAQLIFKRSMYLVEKLALFQTALSSFLSHVFLWKNCTERGGIDFHDFLLPYFDLIFFWTSIWLLMSFFLCYLMLKLRYFGKQFELAYAMKLPMFLHMRAAAEDFCNILEQNKHR